MVYNNRSYVLSTLHLQGAALCAFLRSSRQLAAADQIVNALLTHTCVPVRAFTIVSHLAVQTVKLFFWVVSLSGRVEDA